MSRLKGSCHFPQVSHGSLVGRRHAGKQRSERGAILVPLVLVELADRLDKGVDQQHALVLGDLHRDSSFGEPGDGPNLEVVVGEGVRGAAAFTSAGAWPGSGPADSCRAPAAQAMMIRRWTWPAPAAASPADP